MENKVFIYGLLDPLTNDIRYIGKSNNPHRRFLSHIYNSILKKTYKDHWICKLLENNYKPLMIIIEECNETNWIEREMYHISQHNNLTNLTAGGDGMSNYSHSETFKRKRSEEMTGEKNSFYMKKHKEETKKNISNTLKKRYELGLIKPPPPMYGKTNPASKKRTFISPDGKVYSVYSLRKFCDEMKLHIKLIEKNINNGKINKIIEKNIQYGQRYINTIGWEVVYTN